MKRNGHSVLGESDESAFSDGELSAVAPHDSGEEITRLATQLGISEEEAADRIAELEEHMHAGAMQQGSSDGAALRMIKRGLRHVVAAKTYKQQSFLLQCLMLAIGWQSDLDDIDSPTKLARKFGLTKANADKFYCFFRDRITNNTKPLPTSSGQRNPEVRFKFADIRRQQEKERRK